MCAAPAPSLTVCMIARNEAANLPRSLASVRGVADEVVVVDTGSTDATREVAARHGARVGEFAWCDDFGAARNAALELATCEWVFWLDADEALLAGSDGDVREALAREDALGHHVTRRDLADARDPSVFSRMWQLRLFRNDPALRFRGRCHPDFHPPISEVARQRGMVVGVAGVEIEHWGYLGGRRAEKLRRARRLLELELRDRPGQLSYMTELFRTQKELGDLDGAAGTLRLLLEEIEGLTGLERAPDASLALTLETLMQLPAGVAGGGWTPERAAELAERWFPDSPPLLWLRAQRDFAGERLGDAAAKLRRLIEMGRTGAYDYSCGFDPRIIGEDAALNLGACLIRMGRLDEAEEALGPIARGGVRREQAAANLRVIAELRQRFV